MPKVLLTFNTPLSVSEAEIKDFIETELSRAGGSRDPRDPLFYSLSSVKAIFISENDDLKDILTKLSEC